MIVDLFVVLIVIIFDTLQLSSFLTDTFDLK